MKEIKINNARERHKIIEEINNYVMENQKKWPSSKVLVLYLKKMYEKWQQKKFSNLKYLLFSGIFLSGIGRYPPPPLNGKSSCPKTLSGKGGFPPPPLTDKIR